MKIVGYICAQLLAIYCQMANFLEIICYFWSQMFWSFAKIYNKGQVIFAKQEAEYCEVQFSILYDFSTYNFAQLFIV